MHRNHNDIGGENYAGPPKEHKFTRQIRCTKNYNYKEKNVHYNPAPHWAREIGHKTPKNPHI